jgi:hypothetical protein
MSLFGNADWLSILERLGLPAFGLLAVLWLFLRFAKWAKPHCDGWLQVMLERYKTTTNLMGKLELTLAEIATQQTVLSTAMKDMFDETRRVRRGLLRIVDIWKDKPCGFGVEQRMYDSDGNGLKDEDSNK